MTDARGADGSASADVDSELVELMLQGEWLWLDQVGRLSDAAMADPSRLPGWNRIDLVAHMAGNAQALTNLITWAATGVEMPMYPSVDARNQQIAELAALPAREVRRCALAGSEAFTGAWRELPMERWHVPVRTFHGRTIDAIEICWLRARENHVHSVDLGVGVGFASFDLAFLDRLLDDVVSSLSARAPDRIRLVDEDRHCHWDIGDPHAGDPIEVLGSTAALACWASGRGAESVRTLTGEALPVLPPWL